MKHHFDFSNYPKDHPLYDKTNAKVPGLFKDELGGKEMTEFIALRSKMYAYKTADGETKKLKGITRHVVKNKITFDDYLRSLFNDETLKHTMRVLNSDRHRMYIKEIDKQSLNPFDDKRFILDDGVKTEPFGFESNFQEIIVKP